MDINKQFKINSNITESWYGGYKLEVDITGKSTAEDWQLDFKLPYKIRGAYGVNLTENGNNSYSFGGEGGWKNLKKGEKAKAIFIIDDNGKNATIPKFTLQKPMIPTQFDMDAKPNKTSTKTQTPPQISSDTMDINQQFKINPNITQDWNGGYKLEVDITGKSTANDWTLDFDLPYKIRGAYGVDLTDNGNNSYSFSGEGDWQNLEPGEKAKAIFIIDDNGKNATIPEFKLQGSTISTQFDMGAEQTQAPAPAPAPAPKLTPTPKPTLTPTKTQAPPQISSNALQVGFEQHANNTKYKTDVQGKDWKVNWSNNMHSYASISDEESYSGDKSLKITYPDNAQSNTGASWEIPEQKEYYLSYKVKFAGNFDFDGDKLSGGKLPGLGTDALCSGGQTCTGTNGFSSRYMWRENGKAVLYLYHMDKPGTYGEDFAFEGSDGNDKYFEKGKWHNLVQRVRINDGNQSNGEMDIWMDDEKALSLDNLKFTTDNGGINKLYFSSFHGGNGSEWWPENDVNAYFDDFVVSTEAADVGL